MARPPQLNMRFGWDFSGSTSWKDFPIISEFPEIFPNRRHEENNSPGLPIAISEYVDAEPKESVLPAKLQSFVWVALACGQDKYSAGLHTIIDEQTPDADAQWGKDGIKLLDFAISDGAYIEYKPEKIAINSVILSSAYGESPKMDIGILCPKVTVLAPGTLTYASIPLFEKSNIVPKKHCTFSLDGNAVETMELKLIINSKVKPANIIGKEQQDSIDFTNWKYMVEVYGNFNSSNFKMDTSYPGQADNDMILQFGDVGGSHYLTADLDDMSEISSEIIYKGDDFVTMRKIWTPVGDSKAKITIKDNQWNAGTPAAYW